MSNDKVNNNYIYLSRKPAGHPPYTSSWCSHPVRNKFLKIRINLYYDKIKSLTNSNNFEIC